MNNENIESIPDMEFKDIYSALAQAQAELSNPVKNTQGYGYKYASLDQIVDLLRQVLPKHGLSYTQNLQDDLEDQGHFVSIETIIFHKSGQRLQPSYFRMPVEAGKMSLAQAYGSTITYARRYALSAVFGLASETDTDGHVEKKPKGKHVEELSLQDRVALKIKEFGAEEYAASKGINPATAAQKTLKAIMALSDTEMRKRVEAFKQSQEEDAA